MDKITYQKYALSNDGEHHIKERICSILGKSQYYTSAISLYGRIRRSNTLPHGYIFVSEQDGQLSTPFLIAFVDRSRRPETEAWFFGSWDADDQAHEDKVLAEQMIRGLLQAVKSMEIPASVHTGVDTSDEWLLCGSIHERTYNLMANMNLGLRVPSNATNADDAYYTYVFDLDNVKPIAPLPDGFRWLTLAPKHFDLVRSKTEIGRQDRTLALLDSAAIGVVGEGEPVAWGYVGIDGSMISVFVLPEYRGQGLGTRIILKLLGEYHGLSDRGEGAVLGHCHVSPENSASQATMIGAGSWRLGHLIHWAFVDLNAI